MECLLQVKSMQLTHEENQSEKYYIFVLCCCSEDGVSCEILFIVVMVHVSPKKSTASS
jgi:hypothetical protein